MSNETKNLVAAKILKHKEDVAKRLHKARKGYTKLTRRKAELPKKNLALKKAIIEAQRKNDSGLVKILVHAQKASKTETRYFDARFKPELSWYLRDFRKVTKNEEYIAAAEVEFAVGNYALALTILNEI